MSIKLLSLFAVFFLSYLGTGMYIKWALRHAVLDIPNARSAHYTPTPRGGGVVFVALFSLVLLTLMSLSLLQSTAALALLLGGLGIATLGFLDDRYSISAKIRLLVHFLIAAFVVFWCFTPQTLADVFPCLVAIVGLVWCINLTNFMDGLDGLAASEFVFFGFAYALLLCLAGDYNQAYSYILFALCVLGFLLWNKPKARVFMGDSGSGYLGFVLGFSLLQAFVHSDTLFVASLILSSLFIADASITLLFRFLRKEKLTEAHNKHAYQSFARKFGGHQPIYLGLWCINLLYILPITLAFSQGYLSAPIALIAGFLPGAALSTFTALQYPVRAS